MSKDTIAKTEGKAVAAQPKPGENTDVTVYDFGDDAGKGMEDVTSEERKIPFLNILDPKSKQCKPKSAGGLGAKGGDLYNTATGEIYSGETGVDFIPVYRDHNYPEFIPREPDGSGGGFVGIRAANDPLVIELRHKQGKFGRLKTAEATELTETYYLFGLVITGDSPANQQVMPMMVAFKSTQIGKYQAFINRQDAITYPTAAGPVKPPMWAHMWHLGTRYEEKKDFNWYGWVFGPKKEPIRESLISTKDPLYQQAKALFEAIRAGNKKADYAAQAPADTGAAEEIPM